MTRATVCKKTLDAHMRHTRILSLLVDHGQPRRYFKDLGLSRSLKWLLDHKQVEVSRTGNVYITDAGRERLKRSQ